MYRLSNHLQSVTRTCSCIIDLSIFFVLPFSSLLLMCRARVCTGHDDGSITILYAKTITITNFNHDIPPSFPFLISSFPFLFLFLSPFILPIVAIYKYKLMNTLSFASQTIIRLFFEVSKSCCAINNDFSGNNLSSSFLAKYCRDFPDTLPKPCLHFTANITIIYAYLSASNYNEENIGRLFTSI